MALKKPSIQVEKDHYFNGYDTVERFISYFYQIDSVIKTKPGKVLEIGIGNKTVCNYLKESGFDITTCDIDKNLKPDKVGDIRKIPFGNNSFDTVIACEILEHIDFHEVETALKELRRVSKHNVIISIPYSCAYFENLTRLRIPLINLKLNMAVRIPYWSKSFKKNKEHYWEMGRKEYSKAKIKGLLKKFFNIKKEFQPVLNSYHYFFILEKKNV
ncbi:Methyltransferase domain protein [Candidatus Tiddalikarchaeum anstoanum]|nr:Methyltransferase domain protein [Candidatus Tiddalikarchaeum anstoanum]